jgi:DNA (cytosine-5)-methyltransferase 1
MGLNDERGNVFLHFIDLALALSPKLIVIENVRGLLSAPLVHRPHAERGFGFEPLSPEEMPGGALSHILQQLRSAGYQVSFNLYDTANFGVPQRRERLVLIASTLGRPPHFNPTHGSPGQPRRRTFADAVKGLGAHHDFIRMREKQLRFVKLLEPGQNWRHLPEALKREAMGKSYECSGGRTGFLRRLDWDQPSPTVVTSPTMPATLLAHPVEDRPLSVQEYARLQTFPDDWQFAGTTAQKYRQIGNAVPVEFGRVVGVHLADWLRTGVATGSDEQRSRYSATCEESWVPAV